ncbi:Lrp/AsnC family transcriptional regulator [Azospirillum sp.]|uniref:Lrp/AsnC family transcriptional regulator n=1 Tax=Azospirillum sp. TaxID=34012 RepID=UPI002D4509DB|nr:AsnC family transcriptional regulator [Azospirillum sp.]HYD65926.1 AsnC family transcriptional regulator [Azospirillum sp.]
MDDLDRALINRLQDGLPLVDRPFAAVGAELGLGEDDVVARVRAMVEGGLLTRFGPMYHAERMGGGLTLAALKVPAEDFERVAGIVNALPEVAHNYARDHELNMWFVLATETPERVAGAIAEIEAATGLEVFNFPKQAEYYLDLRFTA